VNVGDAVVVRNKASGLSSTPASVTQITDPGYQNVTYSYSGMTPGVEVGNLIRVIAGTGRGQTPSTITANTSTQLTFQPPLLMDDTSIWIVEAPAWPSQRIRPASTTRIRCSGEPSRCRPPLHTSSHVDCRFHRGRER